MAETLFFYCANEGLGSTSACSTTFAKEVGTALTFSLSATTAARMSSMCIAVDSARWWPAVSQPEDRARAIRSPEEAASEWIFMYGLVRRAGHRRQVSTTSAAGAEFAAR